MTLSEIVPWGRSHAEYVAMFGLSSSDLCKSILGCGDGPAGFNAGQTARGGRVVSVDPIYEFGGAEIGRRFEEAAPGIISQLRRTEADWVWTHHTSPDQLLDTRRQALRAFLEDYGRSRAEGRYLTASLPCLPFADRAFGLALCSHLLFVYSGILSEQFHVDSVLELCRVADEVRLFPLLALDHRPSPHLSSVLGAVTARGLRVQVVRVPYEFQPGGNEMLLVRRNP
jgi:hypothetical protein